MERPSLSAHLAKAVAHWRGDGYPCPAHPLIGTILAYQREAQSDYATLKFLREPQFHALEVYWYVRLCLGTPHIMALYQHCFSDNKVALFKMLGVPLSEDAMKLASIEQVLHLITTDLEFIREKRIDALHEAATLAYPSYILALAMGAGKTILIGTIIAIEFAMAMRYPKGNFMKNALLFAPGTTIIESLRELLDMPFNKILPPDLYRDFLANLKIEFPGRGKDIQAQRGSIYNLIVTNTEKIRLQINRRKNQQQEAFARAEVQANLRLQTIASLPDLGVFSDEAHHTYGNTYKKLKRVRETIDYIHQQTPIIAVVNTTGTPYYKKQPLKEVIVWYGLADGIRDDILKNLCDGIHQYDIGKRPEHEVFNDIIVEFFNTYGNVALPDGTKAKIAFYFKTQQHLEDSKLLIQQAMTGIGENVAQILVNTQASRAAEIDEFIRLNTPTNQKRVILLIGKGIEGWNCPSLFACALIKEQITSSNYVLQAATRCLRQTPGNQHSAKIFLDYKNAAILDKELQDNFGTNFFDLTYKHLKYKTVTLRILKTKLPELDITRTIQRAVRGTGPTADIELKKPEVQPVPGILRSILTASFDSPMEMLTPTGDIKELPAPREVTDCHAAAWKIAARYHVPLMPLLKKINNLYPAGEMPDNHLYGLFQQVEAQQTNYDTIEEKVTQALALIRIQDHTGKAIFEKDTDGNYVHHLRLLEKTHNQMQQLDLFSSIDGQADKHNLSFHYTPYGFDSQPEKSFFTQILSMLNTDPDEVATFLFTGGLTDPNKTDFHFEYLGTDNRYHRYFPDFVLVKKTGEFYIIEIKSEHERGNAVVEAKKKAVERLQGLQPEKFKYNIVYTSISTLGVEKIKPIVDWLHP